MTTMMKTLSGSAAALTLAASGLAMPAFAQATGQVSILQAIEIARDSGMTLIDEIEMDDGLWEIDGYMQERTELELDISAQTGEIVRREENMQLFRPDQPQLSVESAIEIAAANGITMISDVNLDGRKWEIDGAGANGQEIELEISSSTGEVLHIEHD